MKKRATKRDTATQHNTTLHYITVHYSTLYYTTLHCSTLHYTTLVTTLLHYTTQHDATQHNATQHNATQHNTKLHNIHTHKLRYHYPRKGSSPTQMSAGWTLSFLQRQLLRVRLSVKRLTDTSEQSTLAYVGVAFGVTSRARRHTLTTTTSKNG